MFGKSFDYVELGSYESIFFISKQLCRTVNKTIKRSTPGDGHK